MRIIVRFIDANQRDIAEQSFEVRGESPGWTGSFKDSPWIHRQEVIPIPAGAVRFWVVISSAGPPSAVGAFAVRKLVVWPSQGDTNGISMIPPVKPDASQAAEEAEKVAPAGWARSGIRPGNAQLLRYGLGSEVALASFVCQMANQMCAQAQLRCRLEIPDLPDDVPVASPIRHNVVMAVKEAIHNVIKHGHATEIQISLRQAGRVLTLQVSDNGCGFDPAVTIRGNGLDNMERRMLSLQGSCSEASQPGAGTTVTLAFPLPVV